MVQFNVSTRHCPLIYSILLIEMDSCCFVCPDSAPSPSPPPKSLFLVTVFTKYPLLKEISSLHPTRMFWWDCPSQKCLPPPWGKLAIQIWPIRDFLGLVFADQGKRSPFPLWIAKQKWNKLLTSITTTCMEEACL